MIISNWYYFLICIVIAGVAAYFYIQYTLPTYRVTTTILIEEGDNVRMSGAENMLQGIGLGPGGQNLDNQIDILSSRTLIRKTLGELPFDIDCYRKQLFKKASFYPLNPIDVVPHFKAFSSYNQEYFVKPVVNDMFILAFKESPFVQFDTIVSFGNKIDFHGGSFTILPNPGILNLFDSRQKVYFVVHKMESLVEHYRNRLEIKTTSIDGTIIRLILEGTNKTKDKIFLDKLSEVYIASQLEKKNHEANRIIEFIDEELMDVSDSLVITENRLQEFRSRHRIMDISAQAQQIIDQAVVLENEQARLTLVSNYYDYLAEYLSIENNQESPISPATMGIEDPLLGALVQELSGLQTEYYSSELGDRNPLQAQLELKMGNITQSLRETLQGIRRANKMAMDENNTQIKRLNVKASGLPVKERQLLGIEREFNLNNVLYTFLLQKRAEAQIQKASNKPDNELVDPATADLSPVAPKSKVVFLLAILLGFGIPLFILLLRNSIQNTISSEEDILMLTSLPLVGHIPHSRLSYNTVVLNEPQSRIAEAFRSLRTRMEFFTRETQSPILLISSTMPGEGKTFTAVNLASAYSLAGKKTVLVGFDLRRPNLPTSFGLNSDVGLSTYLIGKNSIDDIIFTTDFQNLSVIPAGPIPPNPGELSSSEKIGQLFNRLKENYDFIIVDSSPIGAVSDSYHVAAIADANIVIVRHGKTVKRFLVATLSDVQANGIKRLSLLVNDFKSKKSSYRYAYNYKYEYKYNKTKS
ncbi:MAG: polysaccharide biosynthesis tyrosine autokinase [Bacteroidales bacterium]|nr:polysaccharide biosynthesis tyrosine autokinase [Bacteroidales bacterium]